MFRVIRVKELLKNKMLYIIAFGCIILDQIIKIIVVNNITLFSRTTVINDFFYLTSVRNEGAAWSILSGNTYILIFISCLVIYLLYNFFIKNNNLSKIDVVIYGMLYGGIIGNLIDRIFRGYVIDYLDFIIFKYDFPVFNLADSLIVVAMSLLVITILRGEKNANSNKWRISW